MHQATYCRRRFIGAVTLLVTLTAAPCFSLSTQRKTVVEEMYIDPRILAVSEEWASRLPRRLPLFYKMPIQTDLWIFFPLADESLGFQSPIRHFIQEPMNTEARRTVYVLPNVIRVRKEQDGKPSIKRTRHLFGDTEYTIDFEVGVFGRDRVALFEEAKKAGVALKTLMPDDAKLLRLDGEIEPATGTRCPQYKSLCLRNSNFKEISFSSLAAVPAFNLPRGATGSDWFSWGTTAHLTLTPRGEEIFNHILLTGDLGLSFIIQFRFKSASFRSEEHFSDPAPWGVDLDAQFKKEDELLFLTSPKVLDYKLPGQVACVERNGWFSFRRDESGSCADFWAD